MENASFEKGKKNGGICIMQQEYVIPAAKNGELRGSGSEDFETEMAIRL